MTGRLRWAHVLRGPGLLAALLGFGLTLLVVRSYLIDNLVRWGDVNLGLGYSLVLLAPLAAGAAAWSAGRDEDSRLRELAAAGARHPMARHLAALAGVAGPLTVAYLGAVGVAAVWAASRTTWGHLDAGSVGIAFAGLLAASAVGYLLGWPGMRWIVAPLVAAGVYMTQYLLTEPLRPASSLVALPPGFFDPFSGRLPWADWALAGWQLLLAAAAVAAIGVAASPRRRQTVLVGAVTSGCAVITAVALLRSPPLWEAQTLVHTDPVCSESGPAVCVHPAFAPLLGQISVTIAGALHPLDGLSGVPDSAEQRRDVQRASVEAEGVLAFRLPQIDRRYDVAALRAEVSQALVAGSCVEPLREQEHQTGDADPRLEAQRAVLAWLLAAQGVAAVNEPPEDAALLFGTPGEGWRAAAQRFAGTDGPARRDWLDRNLVRLRACEVSIDELPG